MQSIWWQSWRIASQRVVCWLMPAALASTDHTLLVWYTVRHTDNHRTLRALAYISKMYFGLWESLGVSGSCRTRILGWLNPRVHLTDAVRFRCTWEHMGAPVTTLGAPRITVEQTQKNNIFFGNAVGVPGNHSYYLSFNDFQNSYIHFVFWSLYLCVYVSV